MQLAVIHSGASVLINHDIETSTHKLIFDITKVKLNDTIALGDQSMAGAKANLTELLGNTVVSLSLEGSGNTTTIWNKLLLRKLAESATNEGGVLRIDVTGNQTRLRFTAEIGTDGAVLLNDASKLVLDVREKLSDTTMSISALDHPMQASTILKYESRSIDGNVEKEIDTRNTATLLLPADEVDVVEISYNNGRTCKYTGEELKQLMFDSEDPVCIYNGNVFYGYVNFAALSVQDAWKVKLTTTETTTVIAVKQIA